MTATSQNWSDVLDKFVVIDGIYFGGTPDDYITPGFGDLDVSEAAKLLIRADPFCHPWCKTSIHVQVMNATGARALGGCLEVSSNLRDIKHDFS